MTGKPYDGAGKQRGRGEMVKDETCKRTLLLTGTSLFAMPILVDPALPANAVELRTREQAVRVQFDREGRAMRWRLVQAIREALE